MFGRAGESVKSPYDDYVELTGFAGADCERATEAGFERVGQTGRARAVTSGDAIEDFGRHKGKASANPGRIPASAGI